jgi:hypothetical protein
MNTARKLSLVGLALTATLCGLGDRSQAQTSPPPRPEDQGRGLPGEGLEPPAEQSDSSSAPSADQAPDLEPGMLNPVEQRLEQLEQLKTSKADAAVEIGPITAPFALLTGGSLLVALLGLAAGITAHLQLRRSHQSLRRQTDNLRTRLNTLEMQVEQDRVVNHTRPTPSATTQLFVSQPPTATPMPKPMAVTPAATTPAPLPGAPPAQSPAPSPISKAGLIAALNNGDRQQLRDAAQAELNITSESENAIATGRATATELEEVPGGGSYWLISVNQQHWLFPTDRTLKGFAAAQPSKGLFTYEQQTISKAQLIEPALLDYTGATWSVKTLGRIGTP